mgnify:FL=1
MAREWSCLLVLLAIGIGICAGCGQKPLVYQTINEAAEKGDLADVKRHVKRGAALNANENDAPTPIECAIAEGHLEVVKYLVGQGVSPKESLGGGNASPLALAAGFGHLDIVKFLVASGANVNMRLPDGSSAVTWAKDSDHADVVKWLLDNGAEDIDSPDVIRKTKIEENTVKIVCPRCAGKPEQQVSCSLCMGRGYIWGDKTKFLPEELEITP